MIQYNGFIRLNTHFFRNFRLADLVTIMNGFCGSFSVFSSGRYLLTQDESYLWQALVFPLAGLMFDFFDGKVARWRKSTSLLGQELDSLADLVSSPSSSCNMPSHDPLFFSRSHLGWRLLCSLSMSGCAPPWTRSF